MSCRSAPILRAFSASGSMRISYYLRSANAKTCDRNAYKFHSVLWHYCNTIDLLWNISVYDFTYKFIREWTIEIVHILNHVIFTFFFLTIPAILHSKSFRAPPQNLRDNNWPSHPPIDPSSFFYLPISLKIYFVWHFCVVWEIGY